MRRIDKVIMHCSDSEWGSAEAIRGWHLERGWSDIGYHFVICNGIRHSDGVYSPNWDGVVEPGRPLWRVGAHCKGDNESSVGVCLVGVNDFTEDQFRASFILLNWIFEEVGENLLVFGHNEMQSGKQQGKTCPNFDMNDFRLKLIGELDYRPGCSPQWA